MNSSCTLANMQTDINNIILGNITNVSQLSAGADKPNSQIYGTYPTGTPYARVNGTTFTYSKIHNDSTTSKTHYFRLNFDATKLTTINLAQSYTSGTDTLVNSATSPVLNIGTSTFNVAAQNGLDIVVNNKLIAFFGFGVLISIVDIGHNSTTRANANSMLMLLSDFTNIPNWGPNGITVNASTGTTVPYTYLYSTGAYGTLTSTIEGALVPRINGGNGITIISENPLFFTGQGATNLMYGCYRLPYLTFNGTQIYKDALDNYRLTSNDISLLVD
jgi:hypothetical protein